LLFITNILPKYIYCLLLFFQCVNTTYCQIPIGVWEKYDKYSVPTQNIFVNNKELKNEKDDDGDGYTDNINGIAFDTNEQLVPEYFYCNTTTAEAYHHGTAVANIIAQYCPNALLYGVGFVPTTQRLTEAGILAKTVLERQAGLAEEYKNMQYFIEESLAYFAKNKVKVVNISWGLSLTTFIENNQNLGANAVEREQYARQWLGNFKTMLSNGLKHYPHITFVVAVGNEGKNIDTAMDVPGSIQLKNVIRVGALAANSNKRAEYSNYGKNVIYAPGTDISCTIALKQTEINSGTSLAAPVITARVANKIGKSKTKN
jgi:Subtilase family